MQPHRPAMLRPKVHLLLVDVERAARRALVPVRVARAISAATWQPMRQRQGRHSAAAESVATRTVRDTVSPLMHRTARSTKALHVPLRHHLFRHRRPRDEAAAALPMRERKRRRCGVLGGGARGGDRPMSACCPARQRCADAEARHCSTPQYEVRVASGRRIVWHALLMSTSTRAYLTRRCR